MAQDGELSLEPDEVITRVVDWYLESGDFNGLPLDGLLASGNEAELRVSVAGLIEDGVLTAAFETRDLNPHVLRHSRASAEVASLVRAGDGGATCLYPTLETMRDRLGGDVHAGQPYTRKLALGAPQLDGAFFDLTALDRYLRDPRYQVVFHDYTGFLGITDEAGRDGSLPQRDQVLVQTFGLAYRPDGVRCLVVPVRYLADLSPEHQRYWESFAIDEDCAIAPDYMREIEGQWSAHASLFTAILTEQAVVNSMAHAMGRVPLFRREFADDRPQEFGLFTLPTRRAYREFLLVLDQLLSENIDVAFFGEDIDLDDDQGRRRPSLHLLEEWLGALFRPAGDDPVPDVIGPLREVRRERMRPAHVYERDRYEPELYEEQAALVQRAYVALRALRLILANHPATSEVDVPEWLQEGRFAQF